MLDLHVLYDGTGSTSLIQPATIPANDGATVAGVPIVSAPRVATLVGWGAITLAAANGIKQVKLESNDLHDPSNGSSWLPTGTSLVIASPVQTERMAYVTAARVVKVSQKAAGLVMTYTIDHYEPGAVRAACIVGDRLPPNRGLYSQVFGGALTAQTWGSVGFAPTYNLPAGRYAILGFAASALTTFALFRFQHSDFGSCSPGLPAADYFTTASTLTASAGGGLMNTDQLWQFVRYSELTRAPQCPVFRAGPNGTGLNIHCIDNTADTPSVILNLAYLGG